MQLSGYGSDTGGGDTHQLLTTLYDRFGSVSSFTGTYQADEWRLTIDRSNVNHSESAEDTHIILSRA